MKKKWTAAVCALLAAFSVLGLVGAAASSRVIVYFTSVNETVMDLRADTMPFQANGDIYVPYTVFDSYTTGISLGVYTIYSNNSVLVYSRAYGILTFDLAADTVTSSTGQTLSRTAIRRNSIIFLPTSVVCSYFNLTFSLLPDRDYGFIVRIKNDASRISDTDFSKTARYILSPRYNAYVRSLSGSDPSDPVNTGPQIVDPSASAAPTPPPSTPTPTPTPSPAPSSPPIVTPKPQGGAVYLAFRCDRGGNLSSLAAALARQNVRAVFFFPVRDLARRDDELRALSAAGHRIGLILDDPASAQEDAETGCRLLSHILRAGTDLALTGDDVPVPEGWFAWRTTVNGLPGERPASRQLQEIVASAVHPEDCFLLLDDSGQTVGLLPQLLTRLADAGCTFPLAVETVLEQ